MPWKYAGNFQKWILLHAALHRYLIVCTLDLTGTSSLKHSLYSRRHSSERKVGEKMLEDFTCMTTLVKFFQCYSSKHSLQHLCDPGCLGTDSCRHTREYGVVFTGAEIDLDDRSRGHDRRRPYMEFSSVIWSWDDSPKIGTSIKEYAQFERNVLWKSQNVFSK